MKGQGNDSATINTPTIYRPPPPPSIITITPYPPPLSPLLLIITIVMNATAAVTTSSTITTTTVTITSHHHHNITATNTTSSLYHYYCHHFHSHYARLSTRNYTSTQTAFHLFNSLGIDHGHLSRTLRHWLAQQPVDSAAPVCLSICFAYCKRTMSQMCASFYFTDTSFVPCRLLCFLI